jgi:RNA polymerase sigma-70 factor, ECF subfamily
MQDLTDEQLIEKSKSGDIVAFKKLVGRYEGQVAGVVHSVMGNTPAAEDIGQEVFVIFYDSLNKFKETFSVGQYLIRLTTQVLLKELKRKARSSSFDGGFNEGQMDLMEQLHFEVSNLERELQSVILLRLTEGYSIEETATILKTTKTNVLSRLATAQYKLRITLTKSLK